VRGLKTIDDDIVLSRVRAKEGERFSTSKIESSYEALYGLEAFDSVVLKYDVHKNNIVPLEVTGEEITKPWYMKAGVGWESATGIRLSAEVIRANLFGNAQSLGFGLVYSEIERVAEAEYVAPAKFKFSEYYLDLTAKVGYSQFIYTGFVEDKVYAKAFLSYDGEYLNVNAGLAVENIEISLLEGKEASRYRDPGSYQLVYPFFDFVYDNRDSRINPKNGYYLAGSVEYASPFKDGGSSYLKYDLEGRAIMTMYKDLTLSAVGKLGTIDALENIIPASKLFYAGGLNSNRAYGYKRVGVTLSPSNFSIVGGSSMANLSLEANYPLWDNIYGAVFTDSTMLSIDRFDFGGDILNSAGIGLRYITPIGPLKIDWGANIEDSSQNAIHFQIGQSF
jgi:translocation and assembly module TamA